jgi:Putative peptidoglycan binding domain
VARHDPSRLDDLGDDWFGEPDGSAQGFDAHREAEGTAEDAAHEPGQISPDDDWTIVGPTVSAQSGRRSVAAALVRLRVGFAAGALVVVLLIALAAAGVFSGGGSPTNSPKTTSATTPQTTAASPTTPSRLPSPRAPTSTLKPGDSGPQVKLLQQALARLGYSLGKADASYGPKTKDAVTTFQRAAGLAADGVFGPKTLRALTERLENP